MAYPTLIEKKTVVFY